MALKASIKSLLSLVSAQTKVSRLEHASWADRRPLAGYVTDWNRSMQISEDPLVLGVALLMLSHMFPDTTIVRINDKINDEKLMQEHPDWCTNVLVTMLFTFQIQCSLVKSIRTFVKRSTYSKTSS